MLSLMWASVLAVCAVVVLVRIVLDGVVLVGPVHDGHVHLGPLGCEASNELHAQAGMAVPPFGP